MPDIRITRDHDLGLPQARKLAFRWAEIAEQKLDMECTYEEGKTSDLVTFERPGASGELRVTRDRFELEARLGLLLGLFRERIEREIVSNLDKLLEAKDPLAAFEDGLADHEAKHEGKKKPHAKAHAPAPKGPAKAAHKAAKKKSK